MPLTDDLPDEWQWPPEIDVPTPYPETNLAIKILSCEFIGHDVQAAVGRFVTEQALYMTGMSAKSNSQVFGRLMRRPFSGTFPSSRLDVHTRRGRRSTLYLA